MRVGDGALAQRELELRLQAGPRDVADGLGELFFGRVEEVDEEVALVEQKVVLDCAFARAGGTWEARDGRANVAVAGVCVCVCA